MLAGGHIEVNYRSIEFTYNGKEKAEFIEWTEKNIHKEIAVYLLVGWSIFVGTKVCSN
jgi:hypothetical protein